MDHERDETLAESRLVICPCGRPMLLEGSGDGLIDPCSTSSSSVSDLDGLSPGSSSEVSSTYELEPFSSPPHATGRRHNPTPLWRIVAAATIGAVGFLLTKAKFRLRCPFPFPTLRERAPLPEIRVLRGRAIVPDYITVGEALVAAVAPWAVPIFFEDRQFQILDMSRQALEWKREDEERRRREVEEEEEARRWEERGRREEAERGRKKVEEGEEKRRDERGCTESKF